MAEQTQSGVTFTIPDFTDSDGIFYSEIQIVVQMDGDIRDAVKIVGTLQAPLVCRGTRSDSPRLK